MHEFIDNHLLIIGALVAYIKGLNFSHIE